MDQNVLASLDAAAIYLLFGIALLVAAILPRLLAPRWASPAMLFVGAGWIVGIAPGTPAKLAPLLYAGMRARKIGAEVWRGEWENVGTPEQLAALNRTAAS